MDLYKELTSIALGYSYNAKALRVAVESHITDLADKEVLNRYYTGENAKTDHIKLATIAIKFLE